MRDNAQWSNLISEIHTRLNDPKLGSLSFHPIQDGEQVYGPISEVTLRALSYFYRLHLEAQGFAQNHHEESRHERAIMLACETEIETQLFFDLYLHYLQMEKKEDWEREWDGLPLFTIREGGIAVLREADMAEFRAFTRQPYSAARLQEFLRGIALASVKGVIPPQKVAETP